MAPIHIPIEEIIRFMIVLFRVSGIMIAAPLFSSQSVPTQVRAILTLMVTLIMTPSLALNAVPAGLNLVTIPGIILNEAMVGVIIGFAAAFVFAGLQFAGQIISFQLGFSMINVIDPQTQVESSVFSFLQNYIGLLLFLLINGHHWFFLAVNDSFRCLPVGGFHFTTPLFQQLIRLSADIFIIGVRVAGPIIAIVVITDIVMGILGRAAPQIHILIIGMPLKILIGFTCLSFSLYFLPRYLEMVYASLYKTMFSLIHLMI
jgi:flagellar biosynthesis protein FliR